MWTFQIFILSLFFLPQIAKTIQVRVFLKIRMMWYKSLSVQKMSECAEILWQKEQTMDLLSQYLSFRSGSVKSCNPWTSHILPGLFSCLFIMEVVLMTSFLRLFMALRSHDYNTKLKPSHQDFSENCLIPYCIRVKLILGGRGRITCLILYKH